MPTTLLIRGFVSLAAAFNTQIERKTLPKRVCTQVRARFAFVVESPVNVI
jgi:hypothetical protein